ncbi:MAG: AIPR family protein [Bacteroidales bacterium]
MTALENIEIQKFFIELQEEVKSIFKTAEEGTTPEEVFTDLSLSMLSDSGETENYRLCYDEKISKRGVEHKINAYALSENYETLDLFITIYNDSDKVQVVSKPDADKAIERLMKFFKNAAYKDYVSEIEDSSEIFDLAHTIANAPEIKEFLTRVNIFLLTDGEVKAEFKTSEKIAGYTIYYRVIDINYLFNLSEKSRIPIEIDFEANSFALPCIIANNQNEDYQSYLSIISGEVLANIYEQFGSRLLEQNVRSFLQFTGKINKGIRKTILEEPHMFLAFNNGIAATAEEVKLIDLPQGKGKAIALVKDLQIVNGGQTTASIYHTWKKDKANIAEIFVPVKLSVVKKKEIFSVIVGRISEYANTQNKVSVVDLSSNKPSHIELEKVSRNIWAPPKIGETQQTTWFYERARGQYKNAILKYGLSPSKKKAFESRNPKHQVFTKEDLAKYVNCWQEIYDGKKIVIGPHIVVRGNQKNYVQFMNYNFEKKPDNIFFEDAIAKAILFRAAEKTYGVKPNSIGDMRYITVPYSIAWLGYKLEYKLDLYKIWKNQSISDKLREFLHKIMQVIEVYIKKNAPGSLYGEYAKKEDCWNSVKEQNFNIDFIIIKEDIESSANTTKRKRVSDDELAKAQFAESIDRIKSVHYQIWKNIEEWGRSENKLSKYLCDMASTISSRLRLNRELTAIEIENSHKILDIVTQISPELFYNIDELNENEINSINEKSIITLEIIKDIIIWDKKNRKLKGYEFQFMYNLAEGKNPLTERNLFIAELNLKKVKKYGFIE